MPKSIRKVNIFQEIIPVRNEFVESKRSVKLIENRENSNDDPKHSKQFY